MRDKKQDAIQMAIKRRDFLEKGYELFCARSIESVSMQDVADAAGYGVATLYRYFTTKSDFVIEVAISRWEKFREENLARRAEFSSDGMTGADLFTFYLDSFIELYRQHRDLLRFNQFFNIYIKSEDIPEESLHPYQELIRVIARQFHEIYEKAELDHSMKTEFPEEEVFSTTLHLMLAAVTRYAVGLVYKPDSGFDAEKELQILRDLLLSKYTNR